MGRFLLAVAVAFACAAAAPLLNGRSRVRLAGRRARWCAPAILAAPLLIPPDRVGLRAAAAVLAADLALKVLDFFPRGTGRGPAGYREYVRLLVPFPIFAVVYPAHKRRLPRPDAPGPHVARVLAGTAGFVAALSVLHALSSMEWLPADFAAAHAARLVLFVVAIESLSQALFGLERLAGYDTTPIVRDAYRSRTVAEFWRRWNPRVHEWLLRHVFRPAGGRRAPIRSTFAVFLVSGLFHEVMFGMATSRFDGLQLAFFLAQIPAVLASGLLERLARQNLVGRAAAHALTLLFLASTAILFFRSLARVFPSVRFAW
ncbi:MBOAT family O-acyltransferase [Paludisphaera soli]|uniref:MBOAT family O-acyltransferase n=1 Tax=Paludisphaera soli TaxID=2712865 RepID=UPI0013EAE63B|nr:MBOAT family O-acyltransferase [Paludisphaera soli]